MTLLAHKLMLDLKFIKTTSWGKLFEISHAVLLHQITNIPLTSSENENLLSFRKEYEQSYERVIHLWQDVYENKTDLIVKRLELLKGDRQKLFARKCVIKIISQEEMSSFLQKNHQQGIAKSKLRYGMFCQNQLVAVALFSEPRAMTYNGKKNYFSGELIRFCVQAGTQIYGALDKFLKHYERTHHVNDIMTYVDKDWSNGTAFINLGFENAGEKSPMAFELNQSGERKLADNVVPSERYYWNSGSIKLIRYVK